MVQSADNANTHLALLHRISGIVSSDQELRLFVHSPVNTAQTDPGQVLPPLTGLTGTGLGGNSAGLMELKADLLQAREFSRSHAV